MRLAGETKGRPEGERVPINIDAEVRERLRNLLYLPAMRGVGYSEFIARAVDAAEAEIEETRALLVVTYDVSELDEPQREQLATEAVVQAERSKASFPGDVDHPSVGVDAEIVEPVGSGPYGGGS